MGYKNSPGIFQQIMDGILKGLIGECCFTYLDDIIIFGTNSDEHDNNLRRVLERLKNNNVKVNPEKWKFKQLRINFLGYTIEKNNFKLRKEKIDHIENIPRPTSILEIQKFLGFVNHFHKYIKNCSMIIEPLSRVLSGQKKFYWDYEQEESFKKIKNLIKGSDVLAMPDFSKEFILYTDASDKGLGGILMQKQDGVERVIEFTSRALKKEEKHYGITEKEALAIIWCIDYFSYYLRGRHFVIRSDHKSLENFMNGKFKNSKIRRWRDILWEYDFDVSYIKGEKIPHVDFMSRIERNEDKNEEDKKENKKSVEKKDLKEYGIIDYDRKKKTEVISNDILLLNEKLYKIDSNLRLLIIPKITERAKIVEDTHLNTGHRCVETVYKEIKNKYFWQGLRKAVMNYTNKCKSCCEHNDKKYKNAILIETKSKNEIFGCDLIGPINKQYILNVIDYHTRYGEGMIIKNKKSETVLEGIKTIFNKLGTPRKLVTDGGKEFANNLLEEYCKSNKIEHHITPAHHPQSNGRVEKFNKTIMDTLKKNKGCLSDKLKKALHQYNNTTHSGTGIKPKEDFNGIDSRKEKEKELHVEKYKKNFVKRKREFFQVDELVWFRNESKRNKMDVNFIGPARVVVCEENDSYVIMYQGQRYRRSYSQLKKYYGSL